MKISTQTGPIDRKYGNDVCVKMLTDSGFDGIDYSLTGKAFPWNDEKFSNPHNQEFKQFFECESERIRNHGIEIVQTHSPYRRPFQCDAEGYAMVLEQTIRAIYATGYMSAPYIVVHPVLHPDFNNGMNREKGIEANIKYFSKLVPALKETGVVACIENLYWGNPYEAKTPNCCSAPDQLSEVIDTLNGIYGHHFAACLDTGHAIVCGYEPADVLRKLGKRVSTLHIHDSLGILDDHLLPGAGIIKWDDFMDALYEVEYKGTFNFEADLYLEATAQPIYDTDVMQNSLNLLYSAGRAMTKKFQGL